MKIKITTHKTYDFKNDKEYPAYELRGHDGENYIFGVNAQVSYSLNEESYVPNFGACSGSMEYMELRLDIIKKAYSIARRLNK